jgi:hypothetical protein
MNARRREIQAAILITLACVALSLVCSSRKLFWYDELQTVRIAGLSDFQSYVRSSTAGFDLNPAPVYWLTNLSVAALGDNHAAARAPQCFATALGGLAFYFFLRRRLSASAALPALCLYWTTGAFEYSFEARAYAFVLCGASIFFLGLQRTVDGSRLWLAAVVAGLWISIGFHVTGILAVAAAAPALALEAWRRRRIDLPLAAAVAVGLLPALQYPPIYRAAATLTFSHTLLNVSAETLIATYVTAARFAFLVPLLFLCVCVLGSLVKAWPVDWRLPELRVPSAFDWTLMASAFLTPLAFALAAILLHKPFNQRYGLIAAWGFAAASAILLSALTTKSRLLYFVSAALCFAGPPASAAYATYRDTRNAVSLQRRIATLERIPAAEIAVSNGELFLQLNRYAPPALLQRIVYLEDRERAIHILGTDTVNAAFTNGLPYLRPEARVVRYREFIRRGETFFVFECAGDWFSWQARALREDGFTLVRPAGMKSPCTYEASPPSGGQ